MKGRQTPSRSLTLRVTPLVFVVSTLLAAICDAEPIWELTVSVPKANEERSINLSPSAHFHVSLRNASNEAQQIWKASNSWGYRALRFELIAQGQSPVIVKRAERSWRKNIPSTWVVESGESIVFNISFANGEWIGLPFPDAASVRGTRMKMKTIFEILKNDVAQKHRVWTGRTDSPVIEVVFR